jgi:hypothetical protein
MFGFRLCPLFFVYIRTSPAFLLRAGGRISMRSPAGIVIVFCFVRLPGVFVLWLMGRLMKVFVVHCHVMGGTGY